MNIVVISYVDPAPYYGTEDITLGADSDEEDQIKIRNIIISLSLTLASQS